MERSLRDGRGTASCVEGEVAVIDLESPSAAEEVWSAAANLGFFTVKNHGIADDKIDDIFGVAEEFFALPRAEKETRSPYSAPKNAGYEYMQQVRPSTGVPDVKESIQITTRESSMDGRWPDNEFADQVKPFIKEAHALAQRILSLLEENLPHLDKGTLADAHTIWTEESQCTLRLLRYPPPSDDLPEGSMRAGAHTDWGCVTLLFQQPGNQGLECASSNNTNWMKVDPVKGGIAVNIGDMLAKWSAGHLLSNLHRVRMPLPTERHRPRSSIAFFAQADKHVPITVRDPVTGDLLSETTAGDYILSRVRSNYEDKFRSQKP